MMLRIDYTGQFLDIAGDKAIPITLQSFDIGSLQSRLVPTTSSFDLPPTENNIFFFAFVNDIRSTSTSVYTSVLVTLIDNGIELFQGYLSIVSVERSIKVQVLGKEIGFFKAIESLSLRDLDFGDSPVTFNAAYIESRRAATSGIVCPVVQYGQIDPLGADIGDYYLPSVTLDTIVQAIADNAGYTITGDLMTTEHYSNAIMAYSYNGWPGTSFRINQIMPDTLQTDFVQWLLMAFGAIITESGNVLTLHRYEDILSRDYLALDWTTQRTTDAPDLIELTYGGWAQTNQVTAETPYSDDAFVSGSIEIDNIFLDAEGDLYESPMLVADDRIQLNNETDFMNCASIPWWAEGNIPTGYPPTTPFDTEPRPIILLTRERYTDEPDVTYNGTPYDDYRVGYGDYLQIGNDIINPLSTNWSSPGRVGWLDVNYESLSRSLNQMKIVTRYYNLSITDIYGINFSRMIFDTDSYYLLTKVDKFISGRPTKVQMIKRTFGDIPLNPQSVIVQPGVASLTIEGFAPNITVVT